MSRARSMTYMNGRSKQLRELAEAINAEHRAAYGYAWKAVEHAAECGRRLIEAKALVPHGGWLRWLGQNTEVGARQCQKYMRLAEGWAEIEAKSEPGSHLSINDALRLWLAASAAVLRRQPGAIRPGPS